MTATDWQAWYEELLDELGVVLTNADIDYATDSQRNPWVVMGQRRPSGIGYPHAMVLELRNSRDQAESTRRRELRRVRTTVAVFREGDAQQVEQNLRQAVQDMAAVENAFYANRSLHGACDYLYADESNAFSLENTERATETVGSVTLEITKKAPLR